MKNTIGVALIARNAQSSIKDCLLSFIKEVDQVVVVLAGKSKDNTEAILKKLQKKYPHLELYDFDWIDDFSAARNFSFSKIRSDFILWVDSDDTIWHPEQLRVLADNAPEEVGAVWFAYHYAIDEFGNPTTIYERERLLRAKYGWVWRSRLHETVSALQPCKFVRSADVIIKHNHLAGEPRNDRNFHLLNIMQKESPEDKRVWLYLGHQHFAARNFMKAAEWYLKFGSDKGAIAIERYQALCYCAKAMREMGDRQAVDVALMAVELFPGYRDGYLELANSYFTIGDYDKALHWIDLSENKELITQPPSIIFINPLEYTFNKYVTLHEIHRRKGNFKEAIKWLDEAYKVRPVEDIKNSVKLLMELEKRQRISDGIMEIANELLKNKEVAKIPHLRHITPFWYRDLPESKQLISGIEQLEETLEDKPEVIEADNNSVLVNLANSLKPEELLKKLDDKYDKVTMSSPVPTSDSKQVNVFSQYDLENLVMSSPGRHIINLQVEDKRIWCEYDKKVPENISIRMFLGQGLERWTPKTIKEIGCGGSETAAAWLAREFAHKDCQPVIYAMDTQVWDGVIYRHFSDFTPNKECHLFISSRVPDVFNSPIPAKQKWLWFHDIHCGDKFTPEIAEAVDVIVVLSHWHAGHLKRVYPFLKEAEVIDTDGLRKTYEDEWSGGLFHADAKVFRQPVIAIVGDAIDTTRFEHIKEERIKHRFIWCSSPDRGLEEVLKMWPLIRKALPDATLKIYYGWEYFNSSLWIPEQREMKQRLLELIKQDGVEWCGRVGQQEIAVELMRADIMLYPPHDFRETYGIAFLEAQAAGVMCFYRENGALGETIGNRGIPLKMTMRPEQVVAKIVKTLENTELCDRVRKRARAYGLKRTWAAQANKMLKLYKELEEVEDDREKANESTKQKN